MSSISPKVHHFTALDGLRGVAAIVVLTLHIVQQHDLTAIPLAGLAVDFFYMLSGFVVAFAYEKRLQSGGMDFTVFAWVRITRLYPLVLLGTLAGISLALLAVVLKGNVTFQQVALSSALALLLLPSYVFPQWETAYPFNMASWSLTFELFVNAVYGVIAPSLTSRRLIKIIACSFIALVWVAWMNHGISGGNNQGNFFYGFGRVMFPFFMGVLLFRFRFRQRMAPQIGLGLILGLAALLFAPIHEGVLASVAYVIVFFPSIIAAGAAVEVGPMLGRACLLLGELSYPLYILQGPLLRIGEEILKHRHFGLVGLILFSTIEAVVVSVIAYVGNKLYDVPIQKYLKSRAQRLLLLGNY